MCVLPSSPLDALAHTHTHTLSLSGKHTGPDAAARYAGEVAATITSAGKRGRRVAAYFAEGVLACGGQVGG